MQEPKHPHTGIYERIASMLSGGAHRKREKLTYLLSQLFDREADPSAIRRLEREFPKDRDHEVGEEIDSMWRRFWRLKQILQRNEKRLHRNKEMGQDFTQVVLARIQAHEEAKAQSRNRLFVPALAAGVGALVCFVAVTSALQWTLYPQVRDAAPVAEADPHADPAGPAKLASPFQGGGSVALTPVATGAVPRPSATPSAIDAQRYLNAHLAYDAPVWEGQARPLSPQAPNSSQLPLRPVSGGEELRGSEE